MKQGIRTIPWGGKGIHSTDVAKTIHFCGMMKRRVSQEGGHGEEKDRYKNTNQTKTESIISPSKEIAEY